MPEKISLPPDTEQKITIIQEQRWWITHGSAVIAVVGTIVGVVITGFISWLIHTSSINAEKDRQQMIHNQLLIEKKQIALSKMVGLNKTRKMYFVNQDIQQLALKYTNKAVDLGVWKESDSMYTAVEMASNKNFELGKLFHETNNLFCQATQSLCLLMDDKRLDSMAESMMTIYDFEFDTMDQIKNKEDLNAWEKKNREMLKKYAEKQFEEPMIEFKKICTALIHKSKTRLSSQIVAK